MPRTIRRIEARQSKAFLAALPRQDDISLCEPSQTDRIADHAAGNYRVLMNLADELLTTALDRDLPRLDEKLYLETFGQALPRKAAAAGKKR